MLTEKRRKEIASLAQRKYRQRLAQTLVEGVRAVEAAVIADAPIVEVLVASERSEASEIRALTDRTAAPVHIVDANTLNAISDVETTQGILAVVKTRWEAIQAVLSCETILALDRVRDPGNVGTLIRSAAWFGVRGVLVTPGTVDVYSPKVVRASMGGIWDVLIAGAPEAGALTGSLRAAGIAVYAADMEGIDSRTWEPVRPCALIVGGEAHGITPAVLQAADGVVAIAPPARGAALESLNAAIAGSILLYEMVR